MLFAQLRNKSHTLGFRLTLWYGGLLGLSLFLAFLLFYCLINTALKEQIDRDLSKQAEVFATLLQSEGLNGVRNWAMLEAQAAGEKKIFFRLLNPRGTVFFSSNLLHWRDIGVRREALEQLLNTSQPVLETVVIPSRDLRVRILYTRLGRQVILQVGQSLAHAEHFTRLFRQLAVGIFLGGLIISAFLGWFLSRRAVGGVAAISGTAREIAEGRLDRRVPVSARETEIDQLAVTFNRMLDRIELLVSEIGAMGDNIAHDLKSPLTRIRGLAEVTLITDSSKEEFQQMAADTIEECDRLLEMIDTMLIIARTEAGVSQPVREPLDLAHLAREGCRLYQTLAEDQGILLEFRDLPDSLAFRGDLAMLQRMLANLLDNAVKYTPRGGTVRVGLATSAGTVSSEALLTVADSGVGIDKVDQDRIFKRFYRCDRSRSLPGSGLGLSLAQAVARSHGGNVTVESTPGKGSTFRVNLPLKKID